MSRRFKRTSTRNLVAKEATPISEGEQPIKQKFDIFSELGATGLKRSGGYVQEEFKRELQGQQGAREYRAFVDNCAIVGAALYAIELMIRKAEWTWESPDAKEQQETDEDMGDPMVDEDGNPIEEPEGKPERLPFAEDEPPAKKRITKRRLRKGQPDPVEFMTQCMEDMSTSWSDTLTEVLTMIPYGFAPLEVVYKERNGPDKLAESPGEASRYDDGYIGWRKLALRSQETIVRWLFDENGGVQGLNQQAPPYYRSVDIPIQKILLFRTKVEKGNPEGRSALRSAYWEWYFARRFAELAATGIERDTAGIPKVSIPAEVLQSTDGSVTTAYRNIGENLRNDEQACVLIPSDTDSEDKHRLFDVELMGAPGQKQFDIKAYLERAEQRISMVLFLTDWLLIGHEGTGSRALMDPKFDAFSMALEGTMDAIADVINRHAVPRLFALNGWPLDKLPRLKHGNVSKADVTATMELLKGLSAAGADIFPDEKLIRHFYAQAKWPTEGRDEALAFAEDERERMREAMESGQAVNPITGEPVQPKPGEEPPNTPPGQEPPKPNAFGKVKKSPPWHVEERSGKYVVVVDETGEVVGTHDSKAEAEAQLAALYANAT